ncbi:class I adenylate-forming enzyme family protein [Pseudomaricurvus alkylphenolicus]|uniref:class I adenylate-forming enzyme family protein n=1 Tax=Pseudomaricurvus alkylphenolicus TaxID=1306991 RepID=UPI001F0F306F|nr:AMP-binding protein [Pseudomaricurvus alkylphenolicus]
MRSTIGEVLEQAAKDSTDKAALTEVCLDGSIGRRWTYGELYEASLRLARALATKYPKETRIAVYAHNIPEWVFLEYAAALAGLTLVTINPSFQRSEVNYIVQQSDSVVLYYVPEFRGNPIGEIAHQVMAENSGLKELVNMLEPEVFWGSAEKEVALPSVYPDDPFQIQYTSGTTGSPKGAKLSHHSLLNTNRLIFDRAEIGDRDVYFNFMPLFHTGGSGQGVLGPLSARASMILGPIFDPSTINNIIEKEHVSSLAAVPAMLLALLEEAQSTRRNLQSLKNLISGGAMVSPTLMTQVEQQWGCRIQIVYGQTEFSPVATMAWKDDCIQDQTTTVGQPLPHVEVSVRNPSDNAVLPLNTVGEVCMRGYSRMLEYNNNATANAETIDEDGWLHSGDLGSLDSRGFLKISGRIKEMIIRGGENLFPVEIENALVTHPAIAEVAVIGVPDEKWGELVCCFYRLDDESKELNDDALRDYSREILSPQKTPSYWISVDEWPMTASGKIQKFKLKEGIDAGIYRLPTNG